MYIKIWYGETLLMVILKLLILKKKNENRERRTVDGNRNKTLWIELLNEWKYDNDIKKATYN